MNTVDLIGYCASGIILISFLLKNIRHLRIVNSLGCAAFVLYGCLLVPMNFPLIITNAAIICINMYYLFSQRK